IASTAAVQFEHVMATDRLLAELHKTIPTYAAWPNLAWQLEDESDIVCHRYSNYDQLSGRQRNFPEAIDGLKEEMEERWGPSELLMPARTPPQLAAAKRWRGRRGLQLHIGCGPYRISGWENLDLPELDIREPLPFESESARFIFLEHVIEHIACCEAWEFFEEAWRVLEQGGVLLLAFPDITRVWREMTPEYISHENRTGRGIDSPRHAIRSLVCGFGHQ